MWVCKDLAASSSFSESLTSAGLLPLKPSVGLGDSSDNWEALEGEGGAVQELGLHPQERCFLVGHVGQERPWSVGPSRCIQSAVEGNAPARSSRPHLQICR